MDLRRLIPAVDDLLGENGARELIDKEKYPRALVTNVLKTVVGDLRENPALLSGFTSSDEAEGRSRLTDFILRKVREELSGSFLKPVINASGVILHTNLGRSPLPLESLSNLVGLLENYVSLEIDLESGERGERLSRIEELLRVLTEAEDSVVVNNNAAAVYLILDTFSRGKEVIVSRGELVEIGGHFRLPDVISRSGALLREVGTTNITYISDYASAISGNTGLMMRTHPGNYRILGYTESVSAQELAVLGREHRILTLEDLGSGLLLDLSRFGLQREETVQDIIKSGIDLVCFSGDKLLGGPQAGIILGKKELIRELKANPLIRALRVDKLTIAVLEATLKLYLDPEGALLTLPVMRMITTNVTKIRFRARRLAGKLSSLLEGKARVSVEPSKTRIGGGSFPIEKIPSFALAIAPLFISEEECSRRLLADSTPILARKGPGKVLLDLRTVSEDQDKMILEIFGRISLEDNE